MHPKILAENHSQGMKWVDLSSILSKLILVSFCKSTDHHNSTMLSYSLIIIRLMLLLALIKSYDFFPSKLISNETDKGVFLSHLVTLEFSLKVHINITKQVVLLISGLSTAIENVTNEPFIHFSVSSQLYLDILMKISVFPVSLLFSKASFFLAYNFCLFLLACNFCYIQWICF